MNNEIKEILDIMKKCYDLKDENFDNYISLYQLGLLLDYITNLQQDTEMYAQLKDEYEEEIKDLQQENERLKEDKKKAIEYINKKDEWVKNSDYRLLKTEDLLNILQNGSEE